MENNDNEEGLLTAGPVDIENDKEIRDINQNDKIHRNTSPSYLNKSSGKQEVR